MRWRAVAVLAVVAAGTAGCSASASVVMASRLDVTPSPPVVGTAPAPTTVTSPATASTVGTTVVPPSAPTPSAPAITSHAARLDQLPAPATRVPVGITAGGDTVSAPEIAGPVVPTGVDPDTGELALPAEAKVVAWYQYGPAPGGDGSAVLAGHVDWHGVPGVFFRLRELQPGDRVTVTMSDGSVQAWTVVDVQLIAKPELPVTDVFSRSGPPTLTLVTCGGSFDGSTHHYRSNVVVTATPA